MSHVGLFVTAINYAWMLFHFGFEFLAKIYGFHVSFQHSPQSGNMNNKQDDEERLQNIYYHYLQL